MAIHVDNLIAKGYLKKKDRSARSLEVVKGATDLAPTLGSVTKSQEKWLVDMIEVKFREFEKSPSNKKRDNLYVLVGALHVLGLDAAATAYKSRLPKS